MVGSVNNNLGLSSQLKLSVDEKTGKMTGAADMFAGPTEDLYNKQMQLADRKEDEKKLVNAKIETLANLELMVKELQSRSAYLFNSNSLSEVTGKYGVFSNMVANYSSTSETPVGSLIDLNLGANSNLQQFKLEVTQTASYDVTMATSGLASPTTALNWTGTYTINGHAVALDASMTLTDLRNTLNRHSADTGVKANIVKVADNDYRLNLQAVDIGTPIVIADGIVGAGVGQVPAASGKTADNLAAKFKFNDVAMVRQDNNIEDVVDGLTLVLKKAEVGAVMTVRISPDTDGTKTAIQDWVKSINTVIDEIAKHKVYDPKTTEPAADAVLFNTDIIWAVESVIRDTLSWSVPGGGDDGIQYLEEIGLTIDPITRRINLDEQLLDQALKTNYEGVQRLFQYEEVVSNSNFTVTDHPAKLSNSLVVDSNGDPVTTTLSLSKDGSGNLTAQLTVSGGVYDGQVYSIVNTEDVSEAIKVRGDNVTLTVGNLPGFADNPFKGFQFVYTGVASIANSSSVSTTIQLSQGFGDRFEKTLSKTVSDKGGEFTAQKDKFSEKIKKLDEEIQKITLKAEQQKERQLRDFARLEAFRQTLVPIQGMLDAIQNSMMNRS